MIVKSASSLLLFATFTCVGCGGGSAQSDLIGAWNLDFPKLANQIMGPKMGPQFYKQTFSNISTSVEFKEDGVFVRSAGSSTKSGSASGTKTGTWKTNSSGRNKIEITVELEGASEVIEITFVDQDTIHMNGPPKIFSTAPVKYVEFDRRK
jgi:hypothetical protein